MKTTLALAAVTLLASSVAAAQTRSAKGDAMTAVAAAPATWTIDVVHSELSFRVRHLTGRVRGGFKEWGGTIVADPAALAAGSVKVEVKTASISTENADRDAHLRSADFFDVEKFPAMTFESTKVTVDGKRIALTGNLTIKGVTKPVTLEGTYGGAITDPWGKERVAFEAETAINRKDFGLAWGKLVEGVALVGDEVTIELAVEAVKN